MLGLIDTCVVETRTDLDLYANQCAIGSNALVFHDFDCPINVTGYNRKARYIATFSRSLQLWLMTMADRQKCDFGRTEAILIPDLDHSLFTTM